MIQHQRVHQSVDRARSQLTTVRVQTHRDTSEFPTSGGVSHVTAAEEIADIEADFERALQLWKVTEALQQGHLPSNAQLDGLLASTSEVVASTLSDDTRGLSADTISALTALRRLVDISQTALRRKNGDEILQDTLWMLFTEAHRLSSDGIRSYDLGERHEIDRDLDVQVSDAAEDYGERGGELAEASRHLRTLATIFTTNVEVRSALKSLVGAGKELVEEARAENREKLLDHSWNHSEERTPGNAIIDTHGTDSVAEQRSDSATLAGQMLRDFDNQLFDYFLPPEEQKSAERQATPPWGSLPKPHLPQFPKPTFPKFSKPSLPKHMPPLPSLPLQHVKPSSGMPGSFHVEQTDHGQTLVEVSSPCVADFVRKITPSVLSLQGSPGYVESMTWLLDVIEEYESEAMEEQLRLHLTPTERIFANIATIMERLGHGQSLSPLQHSVLDFCRDVRKSPDRSQFWSDIDTYVRRILLERGYVQSIECEIKGNEIWARATTLLDNAMDLQHLDAIFAAVSRWINAPVTAEDEGTNFHDDPITSRLCRNWSQLLSSLFLDASDRLALKMDMWQDLFRLVLPSVRGCAYVTFPRVESAGPVIEAVLENAHVHLANLIPSFVTIQSVSTLKCSVFDEAADCVTESGTTIRIQMSQIQAEIRDAPVAMRVKSIFEVFDTALADIVLSRQGISVDIVLDVNLHPRSDYIVRAKVIDISFDELSITTRQSRKGLDWLWNMILPTMGVPFLKWKFKHSWELKLRTAVKRLNEGLVGVRSELEEGEALEVVEGGGGLRLLERLVQVVHRRYVDVSREETGVGRGRRLSAASAASTDTSDSDEDPVAEPGGPTVNQLYRFKISGSLNDSILPETVHDTQLSWVYRRHKAESGARLTSGAFIAITKTTQALALFSVLKSLNPMSYAYFVDQEARLLKAVRDKIQHL